MFSLSQLMQELFTSKPAEIILVETAQNPVHEENAAIGCEFLDDFLRMDEGTEEEKAV